MTLVVDVSAPTSAPDELVLEANGQKITGWNGIAVTLRAEGFPNSFNVALSSRNAGGKVLTIVKAGDACSIRLGGDVVITGYVDRYSEGGDAESHTLAIQGRGMTQDLVDCAAEWTTDQVHGNALTIASQLAQPYGIGVVLANGASAGSDIVPWALNYSETAASIIQRVAQNAALLAYENAKGQLVLAAVGSTSAASGVVYGQNVESWAVESSMDERYSEVVCCGQSMAAWGDLPGSDFFDTEYDPNVPRHRRMAIILADVAELPQPFTIRKAKWEISRRAGRSTSVNVTIDSWRDSAGMLWAPNTLIPVSLPTNVISDSSLVISEVTFRRGEQGTHADLVLMPKSAFTPEPISLVPLSAPDATP